MDPYRYLRCRTELSKAELKLFPAIDELQAMPPLEAAELRDTMMRDRFRWLTHFYRLVPMHELLGYWLTTNALTHERAKFPAESWEEFCRHSMMLGLTMLRDEYKWYPYYSELYQSLKMRQCKKDSILVWGPTAGGEIEVAHTAGFRVCKVSDPSYPCDIQAESRLITDLIPFDTITLTELFQGWATYNYVLLTQYLPDAKELVRTAYNHLDLSGYLATPASFMEVVEECEGLGMYRVDVYKKQIALYYKFPGLPITVGE
jgi:hypothetical protein